MGTVIGGHLYHLNTRTKQSDITSVTENLDLNEFEHMNSTGFDAFTFIVFHKTMINYCSFPTELDVIKTNGDNLSDVESVNRTLVLPDNIDIMDNESSMPLLGDENEDTKQEIASGDYLSGIWDKFTQPIRFIFQMIIPRLKSSLNTADWSRLLGHKNLSHATESRESGNKSSHRNEFSSR